MQLKLYCKCKPPAIVKKMCAHKNNLEFKYFVLFFVYRVLSALHYKLRVGTIFSDIMMYTKAYIETKMKYKVLKPHSSS